MSFPVVSSCSKINMSLWRFGVGFVKCVMFDWFDCTRQWRPSWCSLGLGKCGWPTSSHSIHNSTSRILIVLCISCIPSPPNNFFTCHWITIHQSDPIHHSEYFWGLEMERNMCRVSMYRCSLNNTVFVLFFSPVIFFCLCPCLCLSVMWAMEREMWRS